ncbi:MAG: hypothetical protein R3C26_23695 [Calditrichia bacterium]
MGNRWKFESKTVFLAVVMSLQYLCTVILSSNKTVSGLLPFVWHRIIERQQCSHGLQLYCQLEQRHNNRKQYGPEISLGASCEMTIKVLSNKNLFFVTFENYGDIIWQDAGEIKVNNDAHIINRSGANFDIQ